MDDELKYNIIMKDQPDDVSDHKYIIDNLADNIMYFQNQMTSVRNMSVCSKYFKELMYKEVGNNLLYKMMELKYLYHEVTLQLEDIVKKDISRKGH